MTVITERDAPTAAGLSGVLAVPPSRSKAAVIVVGGSEGGMHERDASVLAEEGYAALALAYFGAPGVPEVLADVPVEYFGRAVDFLRGLGYSRIALLGGSRGAEASLLAAAHDERISAVVSVVGSGVVTQGIDYRLGSLERILATPTVPWTVGGEPLPYLPHVVPPRLAEAERDGGTLRLREAYAPLPAGAELAAISIPVERIRGPVLLISAGDDGMWDSPGYSAVAAERLREAKHPYFWEHVVLEGAGHPLPGPPGEPFTSMTAPGPGVTFEMGGDPEGTTAARAEAWRRTLAFLREHLA